MRALPGAPGAIDEGTTPWGLNVQRPTPASEAPDVTPCAGMISLPMTGHATVGGAVGRNGPAGYHHRHATVWARAHADVAGMDRPSRTSSGGTHHTRDVDVGPYHDEDVLLSLQLPAYLRKYPHVIQAFYKLRFHPANIDLPGASYGSVGSERTKEKERERERSGLSVGAAKEAAQGFLKAFGQDTWRGKEKGQERDGKMGAAGTANVTVGHVYTHGMSHVLRNSLSAALIPQRKPCSSHLHQPPSLPRNIKNSS